MKENEFYIKEKCPKYVYSESIFMDNTQERLGIDDISYKKPMLSEEIQEQLDLLIMSSRGTLNLMNAQKLARPLNLKLAALLSVQNCQETLLIFPGEGARPVRDLVEPEVLNPYPCLELQTQRVLNTSGGIQKVNVLTGKTIVRKYLSRRTRTCIFIDDVLVSGSTAQAIKEYVDPGGKYDWVATTWMSLSPFQSPDSKRQLASSGLPNFKELYSSISYRGLRGIPPNNSISTLIGSGEKSRSVLDRYRKKFVMDIEVFDNAIKILRQLIYE